MADIDATLMEQIFHIPERELIPEIHHHRELDDLTRRFEIAERVAGHVQTVLHRFKRKFP